MIEGYPRSGNSYAEAAFAFAQGERVVALAHHSHAAGHVLSAVARGLPTIVIYRDPMDAAASFIEECDGRLSPRTALLEYTAFHNAITPIAHQLVLANFRAAVKNFSHLIERVNARYGTDFATFDANPENLALIETKIDEVSVGRGLPVTRYSSAQGDAYLRARGDRLASIRAELRQPNLSRELQLVTTTYLHLTALEREQVGGLRPDHGS
jgi:hypothetical protein